jgi:GT2 family glycosyltransferase
MGPTAIGLLDLDLGPVPRRPEGTDLVAGSRDALFLVRLHGEPLGVLFVDKPPTELSTTLLCEEVWSHFEAPLRRHVLQAGCDLCPESGEDVRLLSRHGTRCPLGDPALPAGPVTVIVPTAGRGDLLRRCLATLADLPGPDYEVIVVDNRPGGGETKAIVSEARSLTEHPIRYLEEPRPGISSARNRGASQAQSDILVFTDDDVIVDRGWLRWLVEPFCREEVGATTGLVLPLELATPAQKLFELYSGFSLGLERRTYDLMSNRADDRLLYPFWGGMFGSGASMAFRRKGFVAAGGFDQALASSGEDTEALSAVVLRGERLVYEPRSLCWHANHREISGLRRQLFTYGAGFTATLTKALLHDRRFGAAVARSVPLLLDLHRQRRSEARASQPTLPKELARLEKLGMLWGPVSYARGATRSRRLRLDRVIRGG